MCKTLQQIHSALKEPCEIFSHGSFNKYYVQHYRKVLLFLRREFAVDYPVIVRRLKLSKETDGDCLFIEKTEHFRVRINRKLKEYEAIETLLHEWAHVLAWECCNRDYHCDAWGKYYSRIYRKYLKEF